MLRKYPTRDNIFHFKSLGREIDIITIVLPSARGLLGTAAFHTLGESMNDR